MATAGAKPVDSSLVCVGTLVLEEANRHPEYRSLVVLSAELLISIDLNSCKLQLYSRPNGKLLATSGRLQSVPRDVCVVDGRGNEMAVALLEGQIEILSVESTGQSAAIKRVQTLDVQRGFKYCHAVRALKSGKKLVVSGRKYDQDTEESWYCYGLLSREDGQIETNHKIFKERVYSSSNMAISADDSTVFISYWSDLDSHDNGVHAYGIMNGECKFVYRSSDMKRPEGIAVDGRGYIYVCVSDPPCIHQLTEGGELVTVHKKFMPPRPTAIYWEKQQGRLHVTSFGNKEVWRFLPVGSDQQGTSIPVEILNMDNKSIHLFEEALQKGKEKVYNIRVMVVGQFGVGKTTLIKRLLGDEVNISERFPTEGIDVHVHCCDVSLADYEWTPRKKDLGQNNRLQRLAKVLNEKQSTQAKAAYEKQVSERERTPGASKDVTFKEIKNVTDKEQVKIPQNSKEGADDNRKDKKTEIPYNPFPQQDLSQNLSHTSQQEPPTPVVQRKLPQSEIHRSEPGKNISSESHKKDLTREMLKVLRGNADILTQDTNKYAPMTVWDFAGHFAFYTTHQTFLTRRAIYLMVFNVSGQVTDRVEDECYFDSEGKKECKVHELVEVWLNSIHSCASSSESSTPPVILVGTHVDKISQSQSPGEGKIKKTQIIVSQREVTLPTTSKKIIERRKATSVCSNSGTKRQKRTSDISQPRPVPRKVQTDEHGILGSTTSDSVMKEKQTEAKKQHNHLFCKLDGLVEEDALRRIKRMAGTYLDPNTLAKSPNMDTLLHNLEVSGVISVGKYDALVEIMTCAGIMRGIDEIKQTAKVIKDMQSSIPSQEQNKISSLDANTSNQDKICPSPDAPALAAIGQPKKKRKMGLSQKMKKKRRIGRCVPAALSTLNPVVEKVVDTETEKRYRLQVSEGYFKNIRSYLQDKPTRFHLVDEDFAIDNTVVDNQLEKLKKKIVEVAKKQPYWGEEQPTRWIPLEQEMMRLKDAGIKVIPRSLVEDMNKQISTDELDLFLKFHHDIGTILYFRLKVLEENIVLEPQWMIDALKSLITADDLFVLRCIPAVLDKWSEFKQDGKLSPELIDSIWTKEKYPDFHDNKDHILLLMEQLNIIAKPRTYTENMSEIKVENYFLAPCMLRQKTPEEIICPATDDKMESSSVLCYVFTGKYLPSPIFHRLLSACVAHWPLATRKKEATQENLIFCGCGVFQLDESHQLILHFRYYIIFVRVTRQGISDKTPSSKLCIEVREFIDDVLKRIIGNLSESLKFEPSIQCPKYNGDSVNSLIPVSRLKEKAEVRCDFHNDVMESYTFLKYWFQDVVTGRGPSLPSATASDRDRFLCIASLLVDVGSMVLRQLVRYHTVTSTTSLDTCLASNRSTIDRIFKKNVLNQHQMDILFPPNGGKTNLEDYDITLLSTLFNNNIPCLSQQEKNMIKNLRDDRNKWYAHTKSCEMNISDYNACWNNISSTLIVLSQQCGDAAFEGKIMQEIQRIQVSAVPAGSYLDILKTWLSKIEDLTARVDALEAKKPLDESEG